MRDLNELNLNEGGNLVSRETPTPEEFEFLQTLLGRPLPPSYKKFLLQSNGGCPEIDTFSVNIRATNHEWAVNRFFFLSSDRISSGSILRNYYDYSVILGEFMLPIADDGNGNLICLNLSNLNKEKVVLWVHDLEHPNLIFVSDTFEEFIDMLHENPDYI